VTGGKVREISVTGGKVREISVTGGKVREISVTGRKVRLSCPCTQQEGTQGEQEFCNI
jgi:uncharacterized radical SAM superfamily protein